jgi:hypothetical protein
MSRVLILLSVALVMVAGTMAWMWQTYIPGAALWDIYFEMMPTHQLLAVVIVLLTGVGVAAGLKRNVKRVNQAAMLAVALGAFGAILGELNAHFGTLINNFINFTTLAPMRVESLAMLALGLFGAVVGLGASHLKGGSSKV